MTKQTQKLSITEKVQRLFQPVTLQQIQVEEVRQTANDFKHALLVVSLLVNAFFLTGWLVIQVTTRYNEQLIAYLSR